MCIRDRYCIIPNQNGCAIDDAYLYRFEAEKYFLVINAGNIDKDLAHLTREAERYNVTLTNVSDRYAAIAVQGPEAKKLLMALPLIPLAVIVILGNKSYEWIPENLDNICMGLWVVLFVLFTVMSKPNREAAPSYVDALAAGTRNTLSVGVACGIAGIIAGVVTMTGLANVLITAIVQVANGQLIIALFLSLIHISEPTRH